jgi:lipopolysaccharide/colanic/teichoic acid biosynthesis glycosyltransferase
LLNLTFGVLGTLAMLLMLPLLALCIYLDSPGPIFYTQMRMGQRHKPFAIYKFRSMCVNAETQGQVQWAEKDDERATRVGHWLRMTHLDELPQAINILRGEMALIGPRPQRAAVALQLETQCPAYAQRLAVKPGLTGWAQVVYGYGTGDSELQKLQFDLEYIQRRSLRFELLILAKTVQEVLTLRGR